MTDGDFEIRVQHANGWMILANKCRNRQHAAAFLRIAAWHMREVTLAVKDKLGTEQHASQPLRLAPGSLVNVQLRD